MAYNELTVAQAELLALLSEELGEAVQAVGKVLRHGYTSCHPADVGGGNNRLYLERELGDVAAAINLLVGTKALSDHVMKARCDSKLKKVGEYLHHNKVGETKPLYLPLQVGKFYKTRANRMARIYATDSKDGVHGAILEGNWFVQAWTHEGKAPACVAYNSEDRDIVGEWS